MLHDGQKEMAATCAIGGLVVALVAGLVGAFWRSGAVLMGPIFSAGYGLALGAVCYTFEEKTAGIVVLAAGGTLAVSATMGVLFAMGVRAGQTVAFIILAGLGGLILLDVASIVAHSIGISVPVLHTANPVTIGISAVGVIVGALCLLKDFTEIEEAIQLREEKSMEWHHAFSLTLSVLIVFVRMLEMLKRIDEYTDGGLSSFLGGVVSSVGGGDSDSSSSDN